MSSCEWERRKARSKFQKLHIALHTLLPYETQIILGISETSLGSLDPSKSGYRKHLFSCTGDLLLPDAGFLFKAFFKYRAGNEAVKQLQTDKGCASNPSRQCCACAQHSTILLRTQLGDPTLCIKPHRGTNDVPVTTAAGFLLQHPSACLELPKIQHICCSNTAAFVKAEWSFCRLPGSSIDLR